MRRHVIRFVAVGTMLAVWWATGLPQPSQAEISSAAARFSFERSELAPVRIDRWQSKRQVAPRLKKLQSWMSGVGASVALADLRRRGLSSDVCHVDPRTDSVTISPAPGTPKDYTPFALTTGDVPVDRGTTAPTGCLPGDFNEDGFTDLLVYFWGRTPIVLTRKPGAGLSAGAFTASELLLRPDAAQWYTDSVTAADVDGDGHVDLVVGNYFPDGSKFLDPDADVDPAFAMNDSMSHATNGGTDLVLLNKATAPGRQPAFEVAEGAFTKAQSRAWTLAIGAQDLNGDGLPELYFGNDFGPDHLFVNESTPGKVKLREITGRSGFATPKSKVLGEDSFKGMGIDFGDLNSDGATDMFVSNISATRGLMETNYAWINDGGRVKAGEPAPFHDDSEKLGVARTGWGWDAKIADFDNDTSPEVVQSLGFAPGKRNAWPQVAELAMTNDGLVHNPEAWMQLTDGWGLSADDHPAFFTRSGGRYVNAADKLGLDKQGVTRAVATADVDGDGLLDMAIAGQWTKSYFYRNTCKDAGESLTLRLLRHPYGHDAAAHAQGAAGDAMTGVPAIGAQARVTLPDGRVLTAQVDGGNGHASVRSPELHFGLGDLDPHQVLHVDISWISVDGPKTLSLSLTPGRWSVLAGR